MKTCYILIFLPSKNTDFLSVEIKLYSGNEFLMGECR